MASFPLCYLVCKHGQPTAQVSLSQVPKAFPRKSEIPKHAYVHILLETFQCPKQSAKLLVITKV